MVASPTSNHSLTQRFKPRQLLWLFIIVLALFIFVVNDDDPPPLKVGPEQMVPALQVEDLSNQAVSIKPVAGKLLMINVWATWCAPCRQELPSLQRLADALGGDRLELVGLSVDLDEHVVREYLYEKKIRFPSFLDRDLSEVEGVLGVRFYPSTFFVSPDGRLLKVIENSEEWDSPEQLDAIRALLPET